MVRAVIGRTNKLGWIFVSRTSEAQIIKIGDHLAGRAVVHNMPVRKEDEFVEHEEDILAGLMYGRRDRATYTCQLL